MSRNKGLVPRSAVRAGLVRTAAVALGVVMFGAAALGTVQDGRAADVEDLDRTLRADAAAEVSGLQEYFERARTVNLLLAHDTAFTQFAPGGAAASAPRTATSARRASEAMAYLEELYPGRISEACLIDGTGTEIARVVDGAVAPASDLSTEEAAAPFFAPTLALPEGRVHQSAPYLSPDTDKWVISNSTPLLTGQARPWGLVHFEVSLDSFQPATLGKARGRRSVSVVETSTGQVVLRDGAPVLDTRLASVAPADLRLLLATPSEAASSASVDGQRVAVAHLPSSPDNANSWAVVVSEPPHGLGGWWQSVGPAPVGMALAALLLLTVAGLSLRSSHEELRTASLTDELTGLPNRRLVGERLEQALLMARRRGEVCGVLLIDLDRFKEVNDTLGHHHGDLLLRAVSLRLREVFRDSDTVSRLGGDEFAVLLPEVEDEAAALALARRCLAALHEQFVVEGVALNVEASIGLALAPVHGRDGSALMRAADVAMYEAKSRKTGVVTYDADLDVNTPTRLALLGDLRRALQEDQLLLHYQPKVDLDTGHVRGVEALVRWQHPDRGLVPPGDFVPVAEGTGLILPLTLRTLELAVGQARQWYDGGRSVQVAVNLSPRCLLEPEFTDSVMAVLERHQLPAQLLRLEITESSIMADPTKALAVLTRLQQAGVSLSIDDFGTGYSSMAYLKRLPVDELKIDRSFVMEMTSSSSDTVLVRSSIDLGHNLGLSVVAEGVEDHATVDALSGMGCDVLQGYHLARPMDAGAITAWLGERPAPDARPVGLLT